MVSQDWLSLVGPLTSSGKQLLGRIETYTQSEGGSNFFWLVQGSGRTIRMNIRQIKEAREFFGIDDWGARYFGINDQGNVTCHPKGEEHQSIDLTEVIDVCRERGLRTPLLLRFPQVIESQVERMHGAFRHAITESSYKGMHRGVFPFKVNQRREFIDNVVNVGRKYSYGLEVGSKTEFMAALHYDLGPDSLFICNGFKDAEFIEMGCIAKALGKNVVLVIEGPDELADILERAKSLRHVPEIGIRVRLYSRGAGKWERSSGEMSKFGLTTIELLRCVEMLKESGMGKQLSMLHFHIGSQITEIKRIKNAIKEASRVYAKIVKMGFAPKYLNIGGGVGVDYDGSKTSFASSANYSLQEFANDVTYVIGEVCGNEQVPHPDIVTESGRVIAAYHAVVVTDIREVQGGDSNSYLEVPPHSADGRGNEMQKSLTELKYILEHINTKNYVEYYHDAIEYHEELFTLFNLGYIKLEERAIAEDLFQRICHRALYFSSFQRHQLEEFDNLQQVMVSKYLANFSIFQSIPDSWSVDQLFPVVPLSRHGEKPNQKAQIVDITCDSDGCLDRFIDQHDVKRALDLHQPNGEPYYVGFFLVGAYQESLANEHNLFGATNAAEVHLHPDNSWSVERCTAGDPIVELLSTRNYEPSTLIASYQRQIRGRQDAGELSQDEAERLERRLSDYLGGYPYLVQVLEKEKG